MSVDYGPTFPDVFYTFTGQEEDDDLGLYNFKARLYDPVLGRFISPDPILPDPTDLQSFNRYSYCRNNPLHYTDPTGHQTGESGVDGDEGDEGGVLGSIASFFSGLFGSKSSPTPDSEPPTQQNDPPFTSQKLIEEQTAKTEESIFSKASNKFVDVLSDFAGIPRGGTYYVGWSVSGFIADTPIANRGHGTVGSIVIAWHPKTGEIQILLTTGETNQVKGAGLGMGPVIGGVQGQISDLLGRGNASMATVFAFSRTEIETKTGKGREYAGAKSVGLGGLHVNTYTEPLLTINKGK